MTVKPFRNRPIVDRLKGGGYPKVQGLVEWSRLAAAPAHRVALFVIPEREVARPNEMTGVHDQRVARGFKVIIVLKPSVRVDDDASEELEEEVAKVIDLIAGWTHPDASGPCDYAGGKLLSADGWGIAWGVDFTTAWRLRKGTS